MEVLPILGAAVLLYLLSSAWRLFRNYQGARLSGFPIVICPVNPNNFIWMVLSVIIQPQFERYLPRLYLVFRRAIYGWQFREKESNRKSEAPGFVLVTPGRIEYWIEDVEVINAVLSRWRDFPQSPVSARVLDLFGQNVLIANGNDWQRQRRLITPVIDERISRLVWSETSKKAIEMTEHYVATHETKGSLEGLREITFHVLGYTGFGIAQPSKHASKELEPGRSMSFLTAVQTIACNLVPSAIVPSKLLLLPFMPEGAQRIGRAVKEFPLWTTDMLAEERNLISSSGSRNNIMSALVRASDEEKGQNQKGLSEGEIRGNMFVLTIAGFDTTANTLAYALTLLAIDPQLQQWIIDEVEQVASEVEDTSYDTVYPKLVRCLAFMFETLRSFTPLGHIMRSTQVGQSITTSQKTYVFSPDSTVYLNNQLVHMSESIWGSDAREFRPSRWLELEPSTGHVNLKKMPRGTFLAWSGGPRSCPGMKMSQVEFCAIMYEIFQRCRIEPVLETGETMVGARKRLRATIANSQPQITLQMKNPESVLLRWVSKAEK